MWDNSGIGTTFPGATGGKDEQSPKTGDRVTWKTPRGETPGTVEKIVTRTTRVKGHIAKATRSKPEVMVKSSKSGQTAIHKPESLKQD